MTTIQNSNYVLNLLDSLISNVSVRSIVTAVGAYYAHALAMQKWVELGRREYGIPCTIQRDMELFQVTPR